MTAMAPTRQSSLHQWRVPLPAGPAAAAEARRQVRAAIWAWDVHVDPDVAILLTSELVTNAIRFEAGETIMLAITCSHGQLRVDVHDSADSLPLVVDVADDEETGRGLMLVATLSDEWGFYRTRKGKAVYFTLADGERASQGFSVVGTVTRELSSSDAPSPLNVTPLPVARSSRRDRTQG